MPTSREQAFQEARRENFLDALRDYIDARIQYDQADREWRNPPAEEEARLDLALSELLGHVQVGRPS